MRLKDFDFKDKKNKILILGGSILVLLVGGLGLYFNSSNPSYDDIPTSNKKIEQEEEVNINSEESKKKVYVSDIDISDVGKIDEINKNIKDSEKETIKKEEVKITTQKKIVRSKRKNRKKANLIRIQL